MMTADELATLANITIRADLCNYDYDTTEWQKCIRDLKDLVNGRESVAQELLIRLRNDYWENNKFARCMINFLLELKYYGSEYSERLENLSEIEFYKKVM